MKKIVIFSGTTEGRTLSAMLASDQIAHTVCVATGYGKEMMDESPYVSIHVGRMDAAAIKDFFTQAGMDESDFVIDATHPYASEATAEIKSAADALSLKYYRVVRDKEPMDESMHVYEDITKCAEAIEKADGNILLTTGTKELGDFFGHVSEQTRQRTYVRVLPLPDSLLACTRQGVAPDHVIALQGTFSSQLNEALIRQYNIRHLVTKESGAAGGFPEKADAALCTGAQLHIIARPADENGISVNGAYHVLTGSDVRVRPSALNVWLIGTGPGDPDLLTVKARNALADCDAVFGASRLLRDVACKKKYDMYKASDILPVLEKENFSRVSILFSGDTGFFSGAKGMLRALKGSHLDPKIHMIPGISSFAFLAARLGESYDDACLFSIHGKNDPRDLEELAGRVRFHEKTFVLLSETADVALIAKKLIRCGIDAFITLGSDLGYENESIRTLSLEEALSCSGEGIATALIRNSAPGKRRLISVKKDDDFLREQVPMTKACIRHESILRLGLCEGDLFYDIGGGTGSVSIEAGALHPSLQVFSIEQKPEAVKLIRKNIDKAGLDNITVIEGRASDVLQTMPKPDCVFIGGSGGELPDIVDILHKKGDGIRFVITAVSMETAAEVQKIMDRFDLQDEEGILLSVSDIQKKGSHHMVQANNPIWIFSFTI